MASWSEFAADEPRLADAISSLMQQYGPGLGYLATVRADGGPRVHPVSPVITEEGLFCFVIDSPKRRDLERDGRYALHSFPPENSDDEAYVAGRARRVTNAARVARLAMASRAAPQVDWRLFEFTVDVAMVTRHGVGGTAPVATGSGRSPAVQVWFDPAGASAPGVGRQAAGTPRGRRGRRHGGAGPTGGAGTDEGSLRYAAR
ncbi:pyridoxamine 5'-phosphate oxidase family protein [Micromonospora sp. NPDC049679]|uniref:pyridoxamine 5'-phosphate oxidase family protein n=1 Tax=Micromonospora sp. NPDC049679 TaxID=3155920 RepID=UPI0033F34E91